MKYTVSFRGTKNLELSDAIQKKASGWNGCAKVGKYRPRGIVACVSVSEENSVRCKGTSNKP